MEAAPASPPLTPEQKLELARQAFRTFLTQCFWFSDPNWKIEERHIPVIVQELRRNGGHAGYRIAAQLCR